MRPSPHPPPRVDAAQDSLLSCAVAVRDYLQRAKLLLDEQIRAYPKPIPRCDAQFNYLYEQRDRLAAESDRINAALESQSPTDELLLLLSDVLASAPWSDDDAEGDLRRRLRDSIEARHVHMQRLC